MGRQECIEVGRIVSHCVWCGVAIVELMAPLAVGDRIVIQSSTGELEQIVKSIRLGSKSVERAEAGQTVGLKILQHVDDGSRVCRY